MKMKHFRQKYSNVMTFSLGHPWSRIICPMVITNMAAHLSTSDSETLETLVQVGFKLESEF